MKALVKLTLCVSAIWCVSCCLSSALAFNSGSTGTEDLIVTANTTIPLPEDGVLEYKNVHVQSGATLTFGKNAKNTPVTILASGAVTIEGSISVSGGKGSFILPGVGGTGGFDGGAGGIQKAAGFRGEGPGGGYGATGHSDSSYIHYGASGGGGGHAADGGRGNNTYNNYGGAIGGSGGTRYGNNRLIPLIGGSGGGGGGGNTKYCGGGGGGGGGAILIAATGTINVVGSIYANGGAGKGGEYAYSGSEGSIAGSGGGGAGGTIRLVATTITGNGALSAAGGGSDEAFRNMRGGTGGKGRIRLEADQILRTASTNPPLTFGPAYAVYPSGTPILKVTAIDGVAVPDAISGSYKAPDVNLPFNTQNPVTVTVVGENILPESTVTLEAATAMGSKQSATGALAGSFASSNANIDINISTAYPSVITAYVTVEASIAFNEPLYIDGEMVAQVRVSSSVGGDSALTYILQSGREVPAYM